MTNKESIIAKITKFDAESFDLVDPFAGAFQVMANSIDEAVEIAYRDIPESERPTHAWWVKANGERVEVRVPGGRCKPLG